ncbi:unnamed protein product [Hymenolepis diminuta]|uniref:Uncharacterized protein n=1 Tax=Hymenolepis diminuta TaxID=6216 RepID=A0A564ZBA1_HYMDI|nr:unnamed protein product [Hymenolepis diminuta]
MRVLTRSVGYKQSFMRHTHTHTPENLSSSNASSIAQSLPLAVSKIPSTLSRILSCTINYKYLL